MKRYLSPLLFALLFTVFLTGCVSYTDWNAAERRDLLRKIQEEPLGNYYVGRRYFKNDYKFWGYVRKPREPWTEAKLVMFNEHKQLAPDREIGTLGYDNGYEYKLTGAFSGDTVYEPASNGFYPEFVLTRAQLISSTPGPIFTRRSGALDVSRRVIATPQ
jgi:hypothetical protein